MKSTALVFKIGRTIRYCVVAAALCATGCKFHRDGAAMSPLEQQQMIDTLRAAYAAYNRGDIDAAAASLDEQIEWTEPKEFPGGGAYHGREGAKQYLTQSRNSMEGTSEPEQLIVAGDRIVVYVHAHVRPKGTTAWQDVRLADVYTIHDGKIVAMHAFANREDALRWASNEGH
jgi:hypothetical protein